LKRAATRLVAIHGHFYQPPRENPWTGEVDAEKSAAPFHDWNERITSECYEPNAHARVLGPGGTVAEEVNNYARTSWNFGPTLLDWLERKAPATHAAIVAADGESALRFSGHGSAMAQAYSHAILPLASAADQDLQVVWGLRDFHSRFGRSADGMWLAETAVDVASLEALARHSVRFTILAPHQARRVQPQGKGAFTAVPHASIDTTRAYRCPLPSGREIAIFFYDGPTSRAIAFEKLLADGAVFAARLTAPLQGAARGPRLSHVATDGETYGHHHKFGDMGLAYATRLIEQSGSVVLTNYAEFLSRHPPKDVVEIEPNTSWSCVHGVERWRSNCGCSTGRAGWQQQWRVGLRSAVDFAAAQIAAFYDTAAAAVLKDPAQALIESVDLARPVDGNAYEAFYSRHLARRNAEVRERALTLLEARRQAVLMLASCGFFFDDIAGLEPVQVLGHAARAIELVKDLGGPALEPEFLALLQQAPGNRPQYPDGRAVYEGLVKPKARRRH
jgi:alpha-amylase/alpha-mannosidase (GH57 family)